MSAAPKTRPPMSDDQLAKLAVAREKALAVRRAQKVEKLKAEAARLEAPSEEAQSSVEHVATVDAPPTTPAPPAASTLAPPPAEVEPESAQKPKGKKKLPKQTDPVVVVEQSSDDDDTFEAPPGVIFVKRRRTKPKTELPPPAPSAEQLAVDYAYQRMINGEFHMGRPR